MYEMDERGKRGPRAPRAGRGWRREGPDGPPWGRRGGRMRRGDIRTALLVVLEDGPGHGYDLIQRLEEKSDGVWRPSPGSVYPTLQLLEDEGLVRSTERDGKRIFELTDAGAAEAAERVAEAGGTPWELAGRSGQYELRASMGQLAVAMKQVAVAGSDEQRTRVLEILKDARKRIYAILAED
jgi:DNA-binding PadR family transcriptional regulator